MVVVVEVEAVAAAVVRDVVGGEGLCDGAVSLSRRMAMMSSFSVKVAMLSITTC